MDRRGKVFAAARLVLLVLILSGLIVSPALGQQPERVKVLIGFDHQPGAAEQALVHRFGGTIKYTYHIVPAIAATVPEPAIAGLRANPNVTHVELDGEVYALETELENSWGVERIGAGVVHAGGNLGTGVKVAVIDTGIDYNHPDLDDNYFGGWDYVNDGDDPMDDAGHGTHVAGTIAAEDNGEGVVGVAPEAELYALKVLDASGRGYVSDIIAAIDWSVIPVDGEGNELGLDRMDVINMSLGGPDTLDLEAACQAAYKAGILLVASAGNSGNPPARGDNVGYPAAYDVVIAVAATDVDDERPRWSSTGPDVELAAPGVGINSTLWGGGYGEKSGTSMASPHVAGTAALVIAASVTTNDEVRQRLIETADDLGDLGWDTKYGYGLVDADEAAPAPATTGSIAGTVTNASDGTTAIEGATVSVDTGQSATTDGEGDYFITDVPTGDRSVTASAEDFATQTITATIDDNQETTVHFALSSAGAATMHVYGIEMWHKAAGPNRFVYTEVTILDNGERPVPAATVYITTTLPDLSDSASSGLTGSDGTVTFSVKSGQTGTYTSTVDNVVLAGWTYDSGANVETDESIPIP